MSTNICSKNKQNYIRSFAPNTTLKKNSIYGIGVYAISEIKINTIIGEIASNNCTGRKLNNGYWESDYLGRFVNHSSKNPNTKPFLDKNSVKLISIKDINSGEQLQLFYNYILLIGLKIYDFKRELEYDNNYFNKFN